MSGYRYELRVAGRLSDRARGAFPTMTVDIAPTETVISGEAVDEADLHGLLALCRSLGLEVTSFHRVVADPVDPTTREAPPS
ncbi:hypothetical protein LQ327_18800 [Actinomycetospora endophytica]|uniref:Uncharacterized protein n=1 Tax=Actinomycetospora endophytica TaxID=2291215 RepID=A0ABS8PB33_9PSEU|nr:hypothetical protein [Actinomycetospora endophytica]MCD2195423.1 hypothetical protein [Actinomycetospora endophytica]